ncbi:sensor histidine kinase [Micromonospora coxensis]|uniref:Signal transduction histidine kinase n=1 Tax=Micromonospora coxensis TaxID=356852 RepID=A0A1C5GM06_9ACTN|nr:sensor histidine kinase [Micromonospora coxensis]SCG34782.1 Signal transduction histidine kinase [Micromonospora coxensis]
MSTHPPVPPPRAARIGLYLLVAALLAVVAGRALAAAPPHRAGVLLGTAVLAGGWAVAAALPRSRRTTLGWLAALTVGWAGLLWLTPDAVWLAFPLFLLHLHLLPVRWGTVAVAATTAAAVGGVARHQGALTLGGVIGPVIGAAVAVATVLGYQALYRESERRRRLIEQLTATRADLAEAQHTAGVLAERERLAREIHDTLAQGLSSIQLLLRAAQRAMPERPDVVAGHVEQARRAAQDNLAEARRFVRALTPPALAARSLPEALRRLCDAGGGDAGPVVRFRLDGTPRPLPTRYEVALLRIAQSALANAVAHAHAGRVELTLSYLGRQVALDVVDDGVGFDPGAADGRGGGDGGFGLDAMRARAAELGGTLSVESAPGQGTAVAVGFTPPEPTAEVPG